MTMHHAGLAEVVRRDPRYAYEAYEFIFAALNHTQKLLGKAPRPEEGASTLQNFETEVRTLRGVKSVQLEFTNWFRNECGTWVCLEKDSSATQRNALTRYEEPKVVDLSGGQTPA